MDNVIFSAIREAGWMGKSILLLLFVISIYVWAIIAVKFMVLYKANKSSRGFLHLFRSNPGDPLHLYNEARLKTSASPLAAIYLAGGQDLLYHLQEVKNAGGTKLSIIQLDGIENSLKRAISDQILKLEKSLIILATASSASPFLGLFGTVWGIMIAFRNIGLQGNTNIDAVAPGIAEALVATAAGLAVAIPAMIAYNYLVDRIKSTTAQMDNFASEYISLIEKLYLQN